MTEILHFEILRKHGQTHKQTDMGITIPRPPPMGGEVTIEAMRACILTFPVLFHCIQLYFLTTCQYKVATTKIYDNSIEGRLLQGSVH